MRIDFEGTIEEFHTLFFAGNGASRTVTTGKTPRVASVASSEQSVGEVGPVSPDAIPVPADYRDGGPAADSELPTISDELRAETTAYFTEFCTQWVQGFDEQDKDGNPVPQPDRVGMMARLGSSRYAHPLLIMCYERGSLQRVVESALRAGSPDYVPREGEDWLDWIQAVSALIVNVSHAGFPELAGTLDYSSKWRREN